MLNTTIGISIRKGEIDITANNEKKTMDRDEFQKAYGKLVAKAWADEDFKAKLLADP